MDEDLDHIAVYGIDPAGLSPFEDSDNNIVVPPVNLSVNSQLVQSYVELNDLAKQGVDNIKHQIGGGSKRRSTIQSRPSKRLKTGSQKKVATSTKSSKWRTSPLDTQENIFDSPPTKWMWKIRTRIIYSTTYTD